MASQTHHGSPKQNPSIRRPKGYIRQSLSRLSRLITLRRTGGLSHRCQSLILDDPDTTKLSENSLEKLTDAQSITTCASVSTWGIEDAASSQKEQLPSSIVSTSSDNLLPMLVGGKQAKVALSPSLHKSGAEIESIEIEFRDGQRISWRRPRNIMDLPEMVRKDIWRKVVVDDRRLMVCDCYYCKASSLSATQPPLTRTCQSIRMAAIPIFYQESIFRYPLAHPSVHGVRQWLIDIGEENRSQIRHLELAFLNAERAIESLPTQFDMEVAPNNGVYLEEVAWDDGQLGEVEWCIFTALRSGPEGKDEVVIGQGVETDGSDEATTVGTSISFPPSEANELEFEPDGGSVAGAPVGMWEGRSSCDGSENPSERVLLPATPPKVHLTRENGEKFGEPRWSFAGKFNNHVARRLASLSREPGVLHRKSVWITKAPKVVLASDCSVEDDYHDDKDVSWLGLTFEESDEDMESSRSASETEII